MSDNGARRPSRYEAILSSPLTRHLLRSLTARRNGGGCTLESVFRTYGASDLSLIDRVRYFVPHKLIDTFAQMTRADKETLRKRVFGHAPTARTLVNTAASIARYGLTKPQRFAAPIIVVWNITQACNLSCQHCYQNARAKLPDELTQDEQLAVVDELADNYVSMLAFAGGEPLISKEFWGTCRHAVKRGLHVTVATNGTTLTERNVTRLREAGVKIIEISLDSVQPERHNAFRGKGMWEKTVHGIKNAVAQSDGKNYRVSIASTITKMNYDEVEDLLSFAVDLGAHSFNAFNFIPTGRGRDISNEDLTPDEREQLLQLLYQHMHARRITVLSTAPQLGRLCIEMQRTEYDRIAVSHGGSYAGKDMSIYTEYVGGCGAGRCYCAIQPNGKVTPCVFMPLEVGDLRKQSFMSIWENSPEFLSLCDRDDRTHHCLICKNKSQCGGCRARAYNYTGDFRAGDPGCVRNRRLWNSIVAAQRQATDALTNPQWMQGAG